MTSVFTVRNRNLNESHVCEFSKVSFTLFHDRRQELKYMNKRDNLYNMEVRHTNSRILMHTTKESQDTEK